MTTASLHVLGQFDLRLGGPSVPLTRDAQRLVALLALRRQDQSRDEVIRAIWPCRTTGRGARDLGRLFGTLPDEVRHRITVDDDGRFGLDERWSVDLDGALDAARRLHREPHPQGPDLLVFRLELLPDWNDEWLTDLQDRYRRLRVSVLQRVCRHLLKSHETRAAIDVARELVDRDGLSEDSQHLYIAALAQAGRHDLAHQQFVRFRSRLRHEWGVAPSPELCGLVSRAQHPAHARAS
jgi:SARP family transcriptional regulator, regulator of embCAB operon